MASSPKKPDIHWMEGLLTLFDTEFPHAERNDPRRVGFGLGRQLVGLYIAEMLLKYALDDYSGGHGMGHNLYDLFRKLPRQKRRGVERKYKEIINSQFEWAWDVAETVSSLLEYLGANAITDSRYFWEPDSVHLAPYASIPIAPRMLNPLIYALFIVLHGYPRAPLLKRYDTVFQSLADSLEQDQQVLDRTTGKSPANNRA